jgi:penicillin-binding protein 1A
MAIRPTDRTEPFELGDLSKIDETTEAPEAPPPKGRRPLAVRIAAGILAAGIAGALGITILFVVVSRDLPEIRSLNDYHPKQATVVYGKDGQVVARFASERRTVVPFDRIPQVVIDAVIAAEDDEFFTHEGIDTVAIFRCAVKNLISGHTVCGGSTITQQTVKTFLLNPEQRMSRKLKELILAKRVEDALSKRDILYLYLNQIYFGHGAYGVQEAARVYFSKDVETLSLEEAAMLAGLPKSPNRIDPYRYPERARERRAYVLRRMHEIGKIDAPTLDRALATPIRVDWHAAEADLDNATHYAAHVRKMLEETVGPELAQDGGLKVYVGIDPSLQRAAEKAVREGLRALDKRQGWRGPILHLELDQLTTVRTRLAARLATAAPSISELEGADAPRYQPVVWDLSRVDAKERDGKIDLDRLVLQARFRRLELERIVGGLVIGVDEPGKAAIVSLAEGVEVKLPLRTGLAWARSFNLARLTSPPKSVGDVLKKGDVVLVRPTVITPPDPAKGKPAEITGVLEQVPLAQAALVSMEPSSRQVRALVGGYGSGAGTFNRVTQAKRQAGSTFKPFVYGAALETGKFTTVSSCLDRPHVYYDEYTQKSWKPENYDGHFDGEISLRTALTKSKNLCSVWLIHEIGVEPVASLAHRMGVEADLPRSDTLALGSGEVTPLEIVNAYSTIATQGQLAKPIFIQKVVAPDGKILFEAQHQPRQVITPELAYQITSLMQSVVEDGTATRVKVLERQVAGKTGTTNESRDAWFIGFTPDAATAVWVGFDNNDPLGPGETGGKAAIPIWIDFMREAVEGSPPHDFVVPAGIVLAHVDPASGQLAPPDHPGALLEPFVSGTEPTELMTGAKPPEQFGLDDYDKP